MHAKSNSFTPWATVILQLTTTVGKLRTSAIGKFAKISCTRIAYGPNLQNFHVAKISCSTVAQQYHTILLSSPQCCFIFFQTLIYELTDSKSRDIWHKYFRYSCCICQSASDNNCKKCDVTKEVGSRSALQKADNDWQRIYMAITCELQF